MAISYPTSLDSFTDKQDGVDYPQAIHINDVQDAIEALETKLGIDSSGDTNSIDYKVNNFFVSGRKLWLYEDTAPTGWTTVSVTDTVLAVKGGTQAYNVTGGNTAGTWTVGGLSDSGHTHGAGSYAAASHNHMWYDLEGLNGDKYLFDSGGNSFNLNTNYSSGTAVGISVATGDQIAVECYTNNKSPGVTGTSASGNASISSDATWRPAASVGIIVEKS